MAKSALVLGGGGVTAVAWEIGVLAGLAHNGVDLTEADLIIGTSAGSVVAAQITSGVGLDQLYANQLTAPEFELSARMSLSTLLKWSAAVMTTRDPQAFRARIGRLALAASTPTEAERRVVIESRLPVHIWPARPLKIPAVVAETGEFVVFDADSGVSLVDAVLASCAVPWVWTPTTIDGTRYIDGGVRSPVNADLAAGCDRVVVIAPERSGGGPMPRLANQIRELRKAGRVSLEVPDAASRAAIGRNRMDPARRIPSARAGLAQGAAIAAEVAATWT
jgi:NTE family protein